LGTGSTYGSGSGYEYEVNTIKAFAQTATRLANGDTIFTSRGDNGKGPQMIEVNPDKKVVWVLQDWKDFDGITAVQILDDPGVPEIPGQSEH